MKSLLEEDPSELMGLEEGNDPMELTGSEDEEEESGELMGLGDEEDDEEEPFDLDSEEEEEPAEVMGLEEEDDEEEEGEEAPQYVRQRIPGLRLAQGLRAKRRARLLAVAALRRDAVRACSLSRWSGANGAPVCSLSWRSGHDGAQKSIEIAALRARKRARALAIAAIRARRRIRLLKRATVGAGLRATA